MVFQNGDRIILLHGALVRSNFDGVKLQRKTDFHDRLGPQEPLFSTWDQNSQINFQSIFKHITLDELTISNSIFLERGRPEIPWEGRAQGWRDGGAGEAIRFVPESTNKKIRASVN